MLEFDHAPIVVNLNGEINLNLYFVNLHIIFNNELVMATEL